MWTIPEPKGLARTTAMESEQLNLVSEGCNTRIVSTVTFNSMFHVSYEISILLILCLFSLVAREGSEARHEKRFPDTKNHTVSYI